VSWLHWELFQFIFDALVLVCLVLLIRNADRRR
jgi:hypothetical protein